MPPAIKNLIDRIDNLSLRERGAILIGSLAIFYFIINSFFSQPLDVRRRQAQTELEINTTTVIAMNAELQQFLNSTEKDPDAENKEKMRLLKQELQDLEEDYQQIASQLVSPQDMNILLQAVLRKTNKLVLTKVTSLGTTPLIENGEELVQQDVEHTSSGNITINTAYKHGLRIEFSGSFFDTLSYLKELEKLDWNFFWDAIELNVQEYPESVNIVSVYTISLNETWIGL